APVIDAIPSSITTSENVPIAVSIQISDPDANGSPISVSFQVGSGVLSAAADPTVSATGSGTDTVTLTGSDSAIDAYLGGGTTLVYVPVSETGGGDVSTSLSITVTDNNVAAGQNPLVAGPVLVSVTVKAVNNPPQITAVPSAINIDEDTFTPITGIQFD